MPPDWYYTSKAEMIFRRVNREREMMNEVGIGETAFYQRYAEALDHAKAEFASHPLLMLWQADRAVHKSYCKCK